MAAPSNKRAGKEKSEDTVKRIMAREVKEIQEEIIRNAVGGASAASLQGDAELTQRYQKILRDLDELKLKINTGTLNKEELEMVKKDVKALFRLEHYLTETRQELEEELSSAARRVERSQSESEGLELDAGEDERIYPLDEELQKLMPELNQVKKNAEELAKQQPPKDRSPAEQRAFTAGSSIAEAVGETITKIKKLHLEITERMVKG